MARAALDERCEQQALGRLHHVTAEHGGPNKAWTQTVQSGNAARIRSWPKEQGIEVSERGRVSKEIRDAYEAAHA